MKGQVVCCLPFSFILSCFQSLFVEKYTRFWSFRLTSQKQSMQLPETRERELRPLRMIPDNYEKIVLSMDRNFIHSYDGIKSLYLIDWLLS